MSSATPSDSRTLLSGRTRPSAHATSSTTDHTSSPHTPLNRSISASLYASPSAAFRVDDENLLILEIGSRYLRAGFAGESNPRCVLSYSPDQLRRVGDYRQYSPSYNPRNRKGKNGPDWAQSYELWTPDVRNQDLNLLGDRLERLIREVETYHLMLDSRSRKVALVVSAQLPRPLLELAIASLFNVLQCPTVTVLPSNIMAVVSSGLRSGLVIDIGWSETNVSAVFEHREVSQRTSTRASRLMVQEYDKMLSLETDQVTPEEAEDVLIRLGWCREKAPNKEDTSDSELAISLGPSTFNISTSKLSEPPEKVLFGQERDSREIDEDNQPIHLLAYHVLLGLPIDIRETCLSRIIVTGGSSNIPGLKRRLLQELENLVAARGWNPVRNYGSAGPPRKGDVLPDSTNADQPKSEPEPETKITENTSSPSEESGASIPAHLIPQEPDLILLKLRQQQRQKQEIQDEQGSLRIVNSLGPWAGASLTIGLRVRGVVEVEKERFMSVGLIGGAVKKEVSVTAQRQSMGAGVRNSAVEKSYWSLGVWA
jgi:actin